MSVCDEPWLDGRPALRKKCLEGGRHYEMIVSGWRPGDRQAPTPRPPREGGCNKPCPGTAKMAWNLVKAVTSFAADGFKTVDKEEYERRLRICDKCDQLDAKTSRCNECGCYIPVKTAGRVWKCGLGKWERAMRIHVLGFPGDVGGACTELWHTLKLWRQYDADVTLTPTWSANDEWTDKVEGIGCHISLSSSAHFTAEPGVPVISFCNGQFWPGAKRVQNTNPLVWVPCMNWLSDKEQRRYERGLIPDVIVCQSEFQQRMLIPELAKYGIEPSQVLRIRGAFDPIQFPFQPRRRSDKFVVGRISRADQKKFEPRLFGTLGRVAQRIDRPLKLRILGWKPHLKRVVGQPPKWVELIPPGGEDVLTFLRSCDVIYQTNQEPENWPRVGLEAMSAGVPVVADDSGGWSEMNPYTFLGTTLEHEDILVEIATNGAAVTAKNAREYLVQRLASDESLYQLWQHALTQACERFAANTPGHHQQKTRAAVASGVIENA